MGGCGRGGEGGATGGEGRGQRPKRQGTGRLQVPKVVDAAG